MATEGFLAGLGGLLSGGVAGYRSERDRRQQLSRQAELDALDRAQIESALASQALQRDLAEQEFQESMRARSLMQQSPEQLLGTQALGGLAGPPTEAQALLADLGPLAQQPVEQASLLTPMLDRARSQRLEDVDRSFARETADTEEAELARLRARQTGPLPEGVSQAIMGAVGQPFQGSLEDLQAAGPYLGSQIDLRNAERLAQLRSQLEAGSVRQQDGAAMGMKPIDAVRMNEEYRTATDTALERLLGDVAVTDPAVQDALAIQRSMAATQNRPIDLQSVFDVLDPQTARRLRSEAATEGALMTLGGASGQGMAPFQLQQILGSVPPDSAALANLPEFARFAESEFGPGAAEQFRVGPSGAGVPLSGQAVRDSTAVAPSRPSILNDDKEIFEGTGISVSQYKKMRKNEGASAKEIAEELEALGF